MARNLTLADGQLGVTAATVLAGSAAPAGGRIDFIAHNTSTTTQEVVLTFQRAGGTARRIARAELEEDQGLIVRGLPIQADDTLLGVTTGAQAVDYLVNASESDEFSVSVMEATGAAKRPTDITLSTTEKNALTTDGVVLSGLLEEIRNVLLKIA